MAPGVAFKKSHLITSIMWYRFSYPFILIFPSSSTRPLGQRLVAAPCQLISCHPIFVAWFSGGTYKHAAITESSWQPAVQHCCDLYRSTLCPKVDFQSTMTTEFVSNEKILFRFSVPQLDFPRPSQLHKDITHCLNLMARS